MSSNYPPGVSGNTFGAPWNDEEYDCTLIVHCSTSFKGPLSSSDYQDEVNDFVNEIIKNIELIDGVDYVEKE